MRVRTMQAAPPATPAVFCRGIGMDAEGSARGRWDLSAGALFGEGTVVAESEPSNHGIRSQTVGDSGDSRSPEKSDPRRAEGGA